MCSFEDTRTDQKKGPENQFVEQMRDVIASVHQSALDDEEKRYLVNSLNRLLNATYSIHEEFKTTIALLEAKVENPERNEGPIIHQFQSTLVHVGLVQQYLDTIRELVLKIPEGNAQILRKNLTDLETEFSQEIDTYHHLVNLLLKQTGLDPKVALKKAE
jgi:hypothetical protein